MLLNALLVLKPVKKEIKEREKVIYFYKADAGNNKNKNKMAAQE